MNYKEIANLSPVKDQDDNLDFFVGSLISAWVMVILTVFALIMGLDKICSVPQNFHIVVSNPKPYFLSVKNCINCLQLYVLPQSQLVCHLAEHPPLIDRDRQIDRTDRQTETKGQRDRDRQAETEAQRDRGTETGGKRQRNREIDICVLPVYLFTGSSMHFSQLFLLIYWFISFVRSFVFLFVCLMRLHFCQF